MSTLDLTTLTNNLGDYSAGASKKSSMPLWNLYLSQAPATSGTTSTLLTSWQVRSPAAEIRHWYTYSPLEPWGDRTPEAVERRLLCHALIDCAPEFQVGGLLEEIAGFLEAHELPESDDYDHGFSFIAISLNTAISGGECWPIAGWQL